MGRQRFNSAGVNMVCTSSEIYQAMEIADSAISTEVYNYKTIQSLALEGIRAIKERALAGHIDSTEFITKGGVHLSISTGDAQHLMSSDYPWYLDGETLIFHDQART